MSSRRKAREAAVQMLYQMDVCGIDAAHAIQLYWQNLGSSEDDREFANTLVRGCADVREQLDQLGGRSRVREHAGARLRGRA